MYEPVYVCRGKMYCIKVQGLLLGAILSIHWGSWNVSLRLEGTYPPVFRTYYRINMYKDMTLVS